MAKAQEVKDLAMASLTQGIENEKKEQWRVEGRSMLFDAKRVSNTFISKNCTVHHVQTVNAGPQHSLTLNLKS